MKLPNLELKVLVTITNKQTTEEHSSKWKLLHGSAVCSLPSEHSKNVGPNENYTIVSHLEWEATKTTQLGNWWNPAKLYNKKKAPKKGREKETRGKDQSPGMQTAQKRRATRR